VSSKYRKSTADTDWYNPPYCGFSAAGGVVVTAGGVVVSGGGVVVCTGGGVVVAAGGVVVSSPQAANTKAATTRQATTIHAIFFNFFPPFFLLN
jgi:hypothetical protein